MAGDNDITITVDADNRTTAAFGAAARGARTVGEATENANRALRESGRRYEEAAIRSQQLANRQREAADRTRFLDAQLNTLRRDIIQTGDATGELTAEMVRLERQQNDARLSAQALAVQHGRSAEQVNDLASAYRRAERNAQQALRASLMFGAGARLGPNGEVGAGGSGRDDGPGFLARMLSHLPGLGGLAATGAGAAGSATSNPIVGTALIGVGAAAAAALAPLIGGAIAGAIGGAAGAGGVGLGVAGAIANDPKAFEAQWAGVTDRVKQRWLTSSATWVEPLKGSISEVDKMLQRLPIEDVLRNSAGYLDPLTKGVTGFGTNLAPGLDSLVADVGPVIDMLSKRLPKLGTDFGQFFAAIGKGSKGGAVALDDLLYTVGRLTKGLGVTLSALGDMYSGIHDNVAAISELAGVSADWVANLIDGVPVLDKIAAKIKEFRAPGDDDIMQGTIRFRGADQAAEDFKRVAKSAEEAAQAVKDYIEETQKMLDALSGHKSAGLELMQGWLDLNAELKDGKRTLDLNTQAGIDNQKALLDQVEAAEAARASQIALTGDVGLANQAFDENIERIRRMAYALGFDKQQVDALIASLGVLNVTSAAPKVELTGAKLAMEQGIALGALLNNISHTYTARVQVVPGAGVSLGNALHHAIGGPTSPGLSVINEWGGQSGRGGGEVVSTPAGSMVYGGARARGGDGAAGGGGPMVVQIQITGDGTAAASYALDVLAHATRLRGNGNVQLAVMGRK